MVKTLKDNKLQGLDGLPEEILKHGGYLLLHDLNHFMKEVWNNNMYHNNGKMLAYSQYTIIKATNLSVATTGISLYYLLQGKFSPKCCLRDLHPKLLKISCQNQSLASTQLT